LDGNIQALQAAQAVVRAGMAASNKSIAGHDLMTDGRVLIIGLESAKSLRPARGRSGTLPLPSTRSKIGGSTRINLPRSFIRSNTNGDPQR